MRKHSPSTRLSDQEPLRAWRGTLVHCLDDPHRVGDSAVAHWPDGLLLVRGGQIVDSGPSEALLPRLPAGTPLEDCRGRLILPGFIDTHVHYPQIGMIASYGEQLLDWLEHFAYPAEQAFADPAHAARVADFFLEELLRVGTTTAQVFGTVHRESVDTFFAASERRGTRMICGKVLMDRLAPDGLRDTAEQGEAETRALIERWHGRGRQAVAITPRFAITSSPAQLAAAGRLLKEWPDVYLQTHLAENREEVRQVRQLYPEALDYLDVYDRHGLVGPRSTFAHGIHLSARERRRLAETGASIAFCPTSNLFLGSGLLDLEALEREGVAVSLATDVGAGTSLSMLQTLNEAYKVCQLQGYSLPPLQAFYRITLGNARCLGLQDRIGSLQIGREADFLIVDPAATPLMAWRDRQASSLAERLFALMMLGDDRAIEATVIAGEVRWRRGGVGG